MPNFKTQDNAEEHICSSSNQPLVSVVMPAYNHENYVQAAVQSIINQTYKNIELIIVNDGSNDSTYEKIKELSDVCSGRFVRFIFENQENHGTCYTYNKLFSLAKGEYIYVIASDDISKPNSIDIQVNFLANHPDYVLAVGDNEIIDSQGKQCYWDTDLNCVYDKSAAKYTTFVSRLGKHNNYFISDKFGAYPTLIAGNYIPNGYLIRRSTVINMKFIETAPLEDYYLMLFLAKYGKFKFINQILFSYRWHGANTAAKTDKMKEMTYKTFLYEEQCMKNENLSKFLPDVRKFDKFGYIYKHFGIKYIFDFSVYKTVIKKTTVLRLLNVPIYVKYKKLY